MSAFNGLSRDIGASNERRLPAPLPPAPGDIAVARPFYKNMTFQVLAAIAVGVAIGHVRPAWGVALQPLGEAFVRLVKMVVGPIIFLTIVVGIASMGDL